jgi:hypothetical protein
MREMKGKLKKIDNKWFVSSSNFKLPLHPNFITMTDYVWIRGIKVYDGDEVEFIEVFVNPMGREVDPNNLGQNHSKCIWHAKPYLDEKEDLGYTTKMGIEVSDDMVRETMIPKEYFGKDEQKQHLIDMMKSDEELGLYIETLAEYIERLKERRTEDNYKYSDKDFEKYKEYVEDCYVQNLSVYKCLEFMYFAEKEIKVEDVFNDEKKEGVKKVIQQHKILKDLTLINPAHLIMTSDGYGEFPDGYKLTEKGIQYIIEQLNKE